MSPKTHGWKQSETLAGAALTGTNGNSRHTLDADSITRWGRHPGGIGRAGIHPVAGEGELGRIVRRVAFGSIILAEIHFSMDAVVPEYASAFSGFFTSLRGSFEVVTNRSRFRIAAGQAFYDSAQQLRSLRVLLPQASAFQVEVPQTGTEESSEPLRRAAPRSSKVSMILVQLHRELCRQDAVSAVAVQGLVLQAIAEWKREDQKHSLDPPLWLKRTTTFLAENLGEKIDIKRLTDIAGTGPRELRRVFRTFLNRTPSEYLRSQRIGMARLRLEESREPIARVASEVGYYDQSHFCHEFKKATGCSPSEYRELVRVRDLPDRSTSAESAKSSELTTPRDEREKLHRQARRPY